MARYGSGYYTDADSLLVSIKQGLSKAFELTCEELVDEIKQWTDVDIYSQPESENYSPRTEEFREAWDYELYTVTDGLQQAQFVVRTDKITTHDNPFHTIIEKGGTGEDLRNIVFAQTDSLEEDIEFWIKDEFAKKYRANCKKLGIVLQG